MNIFCIAGIQGGGVECRASTVALKHIEKTLLFSSVQIQKEI